MASTILRASTTSLRVLSIYPRTRSFTTTRPWRTIPTTTPALLMASPDAEYLEREEIDAEILPAQEVKLQISESAAEQLRAMTAKEKNTDAALRIAVESGGCHGYQYKMELAKMRNSDDYLLTHPTVRPSNIVIDAVSLSLLNGSSVDYSTELIGSSFKILDNPHSKGSGCGCGVSWELK